MPPEFPVIAPEIISRLVQADIVIAHNASFDMSMLEKTLQHFQLPLPSFRYLCTCRLARTVWPELENHKLNTLAAHIGHSFQHHEAESDALAAGKVMLVIMKHMQAATLTELTGRTGIEAENFV